MKIFRVPELAVIPAVKDVQKTVVDLIGRCSRAIKRREELDLEDMRGKLEDIAWELEEIRRRLD